MKAKPGKREPATITITVNDKPVEVSVETVDKALELMTRLAASARRTRKKGAKP